MNNNSTETVTRAMLVWWLGDAASMLRSGGNHTHARMLRLAAEQLESPPADREPPHCPSCNCGEHILGPADAGKVAIVGGDRLDMTLAAFEHRAGRLLADEQDRPLPDNRLIAFLCDAVRLARENDRLAKLACSAPEPRGKYTPAEAWNAALTLANNICVQDSDSLNAEDGSLEAMHALGAACQRIRGYLDMKPEHLDELLAEHTGRHALTKDGGV